MPSFWHTSPSSSTSTTKDLLAQYSPTSSTSSFSQCNAVNRGQSSDPFSTKRSNSQARITSPLMSPRQVLSPSSSKILYPSQSLSLIGGGNTSLLSRYMPRQTSLDSSYNSNMSNLSTLPNTDHEKEIGRTQNYEMNPELYKNKIPHELNFVTLRKPNRRSANLNNDAKGYSNENSQQPPSQATEKQENYYPLYTQMSGSSSTSTISNLIENENPATTRLDYRIRKENGSSELKNEPSARYTSSRASICSTLEDNDDNNKIQDG